MNTENDVLLMYIDSALSKVNLIDSGLEAYDRSYTKVNLMKIMGHSIDSLYADAIVMGSLIGF